VIVAQVLARRFGPLRRREVREKDIAREIPKAAERIEAYERRIIDFARSAECSAEELRKLMEGGY